MCIRDSFHAGRHRNDFRCDHRLPDHGKSIQRTADVECACCMAIYS